MTDRFFRNSGYPVKRQVLSTFGCQLPWIRGSKERSRQNSRPQDERAKGEEPLVTLDHNLVLEPVRLHIKLLCQDKRGAPI